MSVVYVDTSCLVSIAFDEPGARRVAGTLAKARHLVSSTLLEAELRAALVREEVDDSAERLTDWIEWVHPDRRLTPEIGRVLQHGYVRGADLHHLASALFLAGEPEKIAFYSLDRRQAEVAAALGFRKP